MWGGVYLCEMMTEHTTLKQSYVAAEHFFPDVSGLGPSCRRSHCEDNQSVDS
jgi:hypothetical protein